MEIVEELSQTQRIVLLVDLHHAFQNPNPNSSSSSSSSYISSVIAAARTLLSFPPLSSSLFAFKLFFSSLSPLLSASYLHRLLGKSSAFFSFDHPSQTLTSLSNALHSISPPTHHHNLHDHDHHDHHRIPCASLTAQSLRQIAYDYAWEPHIDCPKGNFPSNLIVLFSPLPRSFKCLLEFMDVDVETDENSSASIELLREKFFRVFSAASDGFATRDIHFSWVDVNFDPERTEELDRCCLVFFESGIKGLGWGFSSTDAIVLGSALVPFGLIYPNIGCLVGSKIRDNCKIGRAELSLAISDVNGQPLECAYCELELFDLKLPRRKSAELSRMLERADLSMKDLDQGKAFWRDGCDGVTKIRIKEVWRANKEGMKMEGTVCDFVLLRRFPSKCVKDQKREASSCFFGDKVLEMLQMEGTEFVAGKPAWHLLLTFLYRENYWAVVSVSTGSDKSVMGILWPFTVHSAILCIIHSKHDFDSVASGLGNVVNKTDNETFDVNDNLNSSNLFPASQFITSSNCNLAPKSVEGKRKGHKRRSNLLQDLTWSSFCKEVFSHSSEGTAVDIGPQVDLEVLYFSKQCPDSKKVQFLKCWMKQIKRCSGLQIKPNELKTQTVTEEETERIASSQQESELPTCSSQLVGETVLNVSIKDENCTRPCLETLETFSVSISQKIQQSLNSEEVDLGLLAERILDSSIHWFSIKLERNDAVSLTSEETEGTHSALVATEVEKLLLRKPRDLAAKYKGCDPSSVKSNLSLYDNTSGQKVREHELQILFRMEILKSMIGASIEEPAKQKMIKEICSLLENVEFNLQGGLFGGESLLEFAGRTIKARYACSLGDVIHRIYTQMEFFSLDDNDGEASSLPNSDPHGDESAKEEIEIVRNVGGRTAGNFSNMNSISAEDEASHPLEDSVKCTPMVGDMLHQSKLLEAREKRERARRFSSFTRRVPDLQRVWAPKQTKVARSKSESHRKTLGRREWRRDRKEVVCETPLVGIKRAYAQAQGNDGDGKCGNKGTNNSCRSVSKALFHRDGDAP